MYVDQQIRKKIESSGIPQLAHIFKKSHDNNASNVNGQLLGYSVDAVNDFAIVSGNIVMPVTLS